MSVSKMEIENILREKIAESSFGVHKFEDVRPGSNLNADYGMDSIGIVNLIIDLEGEFGICFEDSDFEDIDLFSFDQLVNKIMEKISNE